MLSLFAATPAGAQDTVWSATLTADAILGGFHGCYTYNNGQFGDECSSATVLTDDDFTYGGNTYTVTAILWAGGELTVRFAGIGGPAAKTALSGLALDVQGYRFAIDDASTSTESVVWNHELADWTDGQEVSLSLAEVQTLVSFASPEITLCEGGLNKKLRINLSRTPVQPYAALWLTTRQVTSEFHDHNHGGVISIQHTTYAWYSYGGSVEAYHDADSDFEEFTVEFDPSRMPEGFGAGNPSKVTVTIVDDDIWGQDGCNIQPARLSVQGDRGYEWSGGWIDFTVSVDRDSVESFTVDYRTEDGTATAGEDYTAKSGRLTFQPRWQRSQKVRVYLLDDDVEDGGETFKLVLHSPQRAVIENAEGIGTILNREDDPGDGNGDGDGNGGGNGDGGGDSGGGDSGDDPGGSDPGDGGGSGGDSGGDSGDGGSGDGGSDDGHSGDGGSGGDDRSGGDDGGEEEGDDGDDSGTGTTSPRPVANSMSVVDASLQFKRASDDRLYFGIHDGRADAVNDAVPESWNIWQVPLEFDAVKLYEDGQLYIDIDRSDGGAGAVQSALDPETRYAVTLEYTNERGVQVVYTAVFDQDIGDIHLYPDNSDAAVRFYDALAGRRGNTSYSEVTLTATVSDDPDIQPTGD